MDVLLKNCAGLDIHKKLIVACVRRLGKGGRTRECIEEFGMTSAEILRLGDWLATQEVTHVAMESTGVFWKPIFNLLDEQFELLLCNAQHIKQVPGRKTDVKDCQWIAKCLQHGLLRASFVPPRPLRELRDLTRHRVQLIAEKTRVANRIQKTLEDANIKLSSVATDILGVSGRLILEALVQEEQPASALAELARGRLRSKRLELQEALRGPVREHHRFMLRMLLEHLRHLETMIAELSERIAALMQLEPPSCGPPTPGLSQSEPQPSEPSAPVPAAQPPAQEAPSFSEALQILDTAPGIDQIAAQNVLAELGTNMNQFPSADHLASWVGLCPGNNQSAGKSKSGRMNKGNRWLLRTLTQAAWAASRTKNTYLQALYHRLLPRKGKKRAIMAVAHSLLCSIFHMLKNRSPYQDLGPEHFHRLDPQQLTRRLVKRLEALGHQVTLQPAAQLG
jgi:transposase